MFIKYNTYNNAYKNITDLEENTVLGSGSELEDKYEDEDDYVCHEAKCRKSNIYDTPLTCKKGQMRISLPNLAVSCDRTGVSGRSVAIITSSMLRDIGIVCKDAPSKVIEC